VQQDGDFRLSPARFLIRRNLPLSRNLEIADTCS
jgi:hypothetical protein